MFKKEPAPYGFLPSYSDQFSLCCVRTKIARSGLFSSASSGVRYVVITAHSGYLLHMR